MQPEKVIGRAPGRLDVLGGVADYSGSLVLQMPIAAETEVEVRLDEGGACSFTSDGQGKPVILEMDRVRSLAELPDFAAIRLLLDEWAVPTWSRYCLGCILMVARRPGSKPLPNGMAFRVTSNVPASMGVSSSAALEVATLRALVEILDLKLEGTELARLGQMAENQVVGAPCGLMDQLAAAHGTPGALLPILCRPDILGEPVPLPEGIVAVGWPSGVKHDVGANPYGRARTAAFMGKRILEVLTEQSWTFAAEIPPSHFARHADRIPEIMAGSQFRAEYGDVDDPLSSIQADVDYPVRAALRFPIEENLRATTGVALLKGGPDEGALELIGEMMLLSHEGYGAMGLGCPETDRMVDDASEVRGVFGARVSGGGSGGTVVVLLERAALPDLQRLAAASQSSLIE